MANPFKVGDTVRCVKDPLDISYPGRVGQTYVVVEVVDSQHIRFEHGGLGVTAGRFELVNQDDATSVAATDWDGKLDAAFERQRAIAGEDKGYKPDAIDWDKHKQFMRNL